MMRKEPSSTGAERPMTHSVETHRVESWRSRISAAGFKGNDMASAAIRTDLAIGCKPLEMEAATR
jgi:hypothetical protein